MKRLLLPLIAAFALPTAVNAETYWLLLKANHGSRILAWEWQVPMDSLKECESSKKKATNMENWSGMQPAPRAISGICIAGK